MAKPKTGLAKLTRQEIEHNGFVYDLTEVFDYADANAVKLKEALMTVYQMPKNVASALMTKINKHPYAVARKDATVALLQNKGPQLQQNMLDLAFNSRSEMVRYNATKDGLDRVYGAADNDGADDEKPTFVFNFNMSGGQTPTVETKKVIDGETVDG